MVIILLFAPLTFFGQSKGVYKVKGNDKPITRVKYNPTGKKDNSNRGLYFMASIGPTLLNGDNGGRYKLGFDGNLGLGYQIHDFVGLEARFGYATLGGKYDKIKRFNYRFISHFFTDIFKCLLTNYILNIILLWIASLVKSTRTSFLS